jgi:hypothetical protein
MINDIKCLNCEESLFEAKICNKTNMLLSKESIEKIRYCRFFKKIAEINLNIMYLAIQQLNEKIDCMNIKIDYIIKKLKNNKD